MNIIYGRIPVLELLKSDQPVDKILIADSENKGSILKIIAIAKEKNIIIKKVSKSRLDALSFNSNHQNIIAFVAAYKYSDLDDIFDLAKSRNQEPFIIILDEIEDPHNMGAIIRTAEVAGAHGVIIPSRRSASLSPVVMKISAGGAAKIPVVRVVNLNNIIKELKEKNIWVYCLESDGKNWTKFDYKGPIAVVVGSEGNGVSQLVKKNSDFIVSLPVLGTINSLNASVAAGVFMYEVVRQRNI
ncbi:MAG: 23S rRNA (guanosine(2251)-2'-O)-methyltransferase RlmB [Oscillospiraceae bacterium]|nr:23S rRNA (guanosine(2251)-2'-O)-methyltransferase RlmB [Oscillospiraceae bacterium]